MLLAFFLAIAPVFAKPMTEPALVACVQEARHPTGGRVLIGAAGPDTEKAMRRIAEDNPQLSLHIVRVPIIGNVDAEMNRALVSTDLMCGFRVQLLGQGQFEVDSFGTCNGLHPAETALASLPVAPLESAHGAKPSPPPTPDTASRATTDPAAVDTPTAPLLASVPELPPHAGTSSAPEVAPFRDSPRASPDCCCDVASQIKAGKTTVEVLKRAGAKIPVSTSDVARLPSAIDMPTDYCTEGLHSSCVDSSVCAREYKDAAKAVASMAMQTVRASQGQAYTASERKAVESLAGDGVQLVQLAGQIRNMRIKAYPPKAGRGPGGGIFSKVLTCDADANRPGIGIGWCHEGDYIGITQVGSGFYAHTDGSFYGGAQASIINLLYGNFNGGIQVSLMQNLVMHDFSGLAQVSMGNVVQGDFVGIGQFGVVNSAGSFRGLTQLGGVNTSGKGPLVQGGLICDADEMTGLQVGALLNRGSISGVATSVIANYHGATKGLQLGFYNHAASMQGLQVGVVNYARKMEGVQIGLVNLIHEGGLPFMVLVNAGFAR